MLAVERRNLILEKLQDEKKVVVSELSALFDVSEEIAQTRVGAEKDRMESAGNEFHKRVRNGYLEIAKQEPSRVKVIDANLSIEEVFQQVKKYIDEII